MAVRNPSTAARASGAGALTIIRVIEVLTDEGKSDDQRRDEFLALFFVD